MKMTSKSKKETNLQEEIGNNLKISKINKIICRTGAIINHGLYIFYPIFEVSLFLRTFFFENSVLMYGLYSRAACNQERLMMARVR